MNSHDAARGTKRSCQACQARYYDLGRDPVCPKCGVAYVEPPRAMPTHRVRRTKAVPVAPAVEVDTPVMDGGGAEVPNVVGDEDEDGDEAKSEETEEAEKET